MTVHEKLDELLKNGTKKCSIDVIASSVLAQTIDLTSYENYKNFTLANFLFVPKTIYACSSGSVTETFSYSYNNTTGKLSITAGGGTSSNSVYKCCCSVDIYLIQLCD